MRPILTIPPVDIPVSLAEIKRHVSAEDFTDDDVLLQACASSAVAMLDGYSGLLGRCLHTQTWSVGFPDWCDRLRIPFPDVSAVVLTYLPSSGAAMTVDASNYILSEDTRGAFVDLKSTFSTPGLNDDDPFPVILSVTAGYGVADDVPWAIKAAILVITAHLYRFRDGAPEGGDIPEIAKSFIRPFRRVGL